VAHNQSSLYPCQDSYSAGALWVMLFLSCARPRLAINVPSSSKAPNWNPMLLCVQWCELHCDEQRRKDGFGSCSDERAARHYQATPRQGERRIFVSFSVGNSSNPQSCNKVCAGCSLFQVGSAKTVSEDVLRKGQPASQCRGKTGECMRVCVGCS
jgi:hypothetical protein